ncbi:hypothetical protein L208DRAFT_1335380, partial [Tricholoma matsutake]
FLKAPSVTTINECSSKYIEGTSNNALCQVVCFICAWELFEGEVSPWAVTELPNSTLLMPTERHMAHKLTAGLLLHTAAIDKQGWGHMCKECECHLEAAKQPPLALANRLWVGEVLFELAILMLPEQILIARYFPAAYIVKMFPKKKGACFWDKKMMNSSLQGNISMYKLNIDDLGDMVSGTMMPPPSQILTVTIGITFVGPTGVQECTLPDFFQVHRQRVLDALRWLKCHNPLYANIKIAQERLEQLPLDGVPQELLAVVKVSDDSGLLASEHASYVPKNDKDCPEYILAAGASGLWVLETNC